MAYFGSSLMITMVIPKLARLALEIIHFYSGTLEDKGAGAAERRAMGAFLATPTNRNIHCPIVVS